MSLSSWEFTNQILSMTPSEVLMSSRAICLLAFVALISAVSAQTTVMPPARVIAAQRLPALGDSLAPEGSKSAPLGGGSNFTYAM